MVHRSESLDDFSINFWMIFRFLMLLVYLSVWKFRFFCSEWSNFDLEIVFPQCKRRKTQKSLLWIPPGWENKTRKSELSIRQSRISHLSRIGYPGRLFRKFRAPVHNDSWIQDFQLLTRPFSKQKLIIVWQQIWTGDWTKLYNAHCIINRFQHQKILYGPPSQ